MQTRRRAPKHSELPSRSRSQSPSPMLSRSCSASKPSRADEEVAAAQADKVRFLLDATLGVINIRQSDVIKIFSVVAFVFLPPTLIASIYGMNFVHMPELQWVWGYPMALGLMVISALVPTGKVASAFGRSISM